MLQKTKGVVLRSVKYGDSSLVTTIFTASYGLQTYLVQGVRSSKIKNHRAGLLQAATLLELVVYHRPQQNLQRIREFQLAYIYTSLQQEVVKNSIALFSVELLLRLLPEHASMPELFDLMFDYFTQLDKKPIHSVANFPLYLIILCSDHLGYTIKGAYSALTPHLNLREGSFTSNTPVTSPFINDEDTQALGRLIKAKDLSKLQDVEMNAPMRMRLIDWYIEFLHQHTQHLGNIKSLAILQAILH